jgi:hypothetical protein
MTPRDKADWEFWKRVATLLDTQLHGWSYRDSASFVNPHTEVGGVAAAKLIEQEDEIIRLKALAKHVINAAGDVAAMPIEEWVEDRLREIDNA